MNLDLPPDAADFATSAEKAFLALGGVDGARQAEAQPGWRREAVWPALQAVGAADLDPRSDEVSAAAAGELCRAAGRSVLPFPVVGFLLRHLPTELPLALVSAAPGRVDHGDLFESWLVATLDGTSAVSAPGPNPHTLGSKLGPFVTDLTPVRTSHPVEVPAADIDLHLTLTGWRILGVLERALELAVGHVRDREQFGQALAGFQAVQFQLADAAVEVDGLRELCRYTLWRLLDQPGAARADALALRLRALDAARVVLRTCQQLHGASGLCDEYDVSILVRHVQPDLRLPFGAERTARELVQAVSRDGFAGLFAHGGPP